jgi:hypothetical protein
VRKLTLMLAAASLVTAIGVAPPGQAQVQRQFIQIETVMTYSGSLTYTVANGFDHWTYSGPLVFAYELYSCQCATSGRLTITVSGNPLNLVWKGTFHVAWSAGNPDTSSGTLQMSAITYGNRQVFEGTFTSGQYKGKHLHGLIRITGPLREGTPFSGTVSAGS